MATGSGTSRYTPEQRSVIRRSLRVAQRLNASPRERKALVEALGVESGYRNLPYGDRDSVGALQQRPGKGWGPAGEPLETDVSQFLRAAMKVNRSGFHGSAGSLAQAVQRSAFPGKYDQRSSEADSLLGQFLGSDSGGGGGLQPQTQGPPALPGLTLTPGGSTAGLIQSLLHQEQAPPVGALTPSATAAHAALPAGYQGIQSSGGPVRSQRDLSGLLGALSAQNPGLPTLGSPSTGGDAQNAGNAPEIPAGAIRGGVKKFEGAPVAAWIQPILRYARAHGWKGSVTSGFRSREEQAAIYNSGQRPAAKPGTSNHEGSDYPRGAVDVSDAESLAAILRSSPYRKRLVWAGAKDKVHFSHPHGGSY